MTTHRRLMNPFTSFSTMLLVMLLCMEQTQLLLVIEANDDANGIFSLESHGETCRRGPRTNNFNVLRARGHFGEETKPIVLEAVSDKLPEFNEFFVLSLVNISGGYPGEGGRLAEISLNASVLIPYNDDPFGVFCHL
ncbi:hypothetical protein JOQ06_011372 [Pogonophryne albipinna]|uniref:Uncharacterized protein n=1 Tax=Pogonophryne albipinna TaxID=1090488 RepID=A0AAD6BEN4_9TELE|nr:hypothetical protein JOQ06_011372 [Pogonophryne albipinna]